MDTIEFLKIEESYQCFRLLINQFDPEDQQEQFLDFVKGLSKLTKKQVKVISDFADRYRQEEWYIPNGMAVYSILERLAKEDGIRVKKRHIKKQTSKGERCASMVSVNPRVITLDASLPMISETSNNDLIWHLANQMSALQLFDGNPGGYGDMTRCEDETKTKVFHKQTRNFARLLLDGIDMALWARRQP